MGPIVGTSPTLTGAAARRLGTPRLTTALGPGTLVGTPTGTYALDPNASVAMVAAPPHAGPMAPVAGPDVSAPRSNAAALGTGTTTGTAAAPIAGASTGASVGPARALACVAGMLRDGAPLRPIAVERNALGGRRRIGTPPAKAVYAKPIATSVAKVATLRPTGACRAGVAAIGLVGPTGAASGPSTARTTGLTGTREKVSNK